MIISVDHRGEGTESTALARPGSQNSRTEKRAPLFLLRAIAHLLQQHHIARGVPQGRVDFTAPSDFITVGVSHDFQREVHVTAARKAMAQLHRAALTEALSLSNEHNRTVRSYEKHFCSMQNTACFLHYFSKPSLQQGSTAGTNGV